MKEVKFRAWIKSLRVMADVLSIDYEDETVLLKGHERDTIASFSQVDLLQYTELKDKNGVEIYEGDVVKHIDILAGIESVGKVYWKHGSLVFDVKIDDLVYDVPVYRIHPDNQEGYKGSLEVIGNIYEDKELKEQNKCQKLTKRNMSY